jgi:C-terminal processing protease CtpA/Prc
VASNIQKYYFDREMGPKIAETLLLHYKRGEDGVADPRTLAALLTLQAWQAGGDHKLVVRYSATPLPELSTSQTAEAQARYRQTVLQSNCLLQSVNILPGNIGYLKLNGFPDPDVCRPAFERAMSSLNGVNALIIDLRDNMGGQPEMVAFLASYFFNRPTYLYNPRGGSQKASSTQSPISGNRLADKPVYLLTSHVTTSAAEQFCYNLKKLKRATLVGEITNGSTHSGTWHRIDAHFGMGIPETKVVNPYGEFDWEGFGVAPDIKVNAADALEVATKLAEKSPR